MYNSFTIHKHNSEVLQTHSITVRVHLWLSPFGQGCSPALLQSSHHCPHLVTNVRQFQEVTYKNIIFLCHLTLSRHIPLVQFHLLFSQCHIQLSVCCNAAFSLSSVSSMSVFRHFTFDIRWIIRKSSLRAPYADPEVHYGIQFHFQF